MKRSIKDYLIIYFKGMAMGAADVVPGVSGGTIAFISGIYQELISTINNLNISLLRSIQREGFKTTWINANGNFLLALFSGIIVSFLSLAKLVEWLLIHHPILLWSFFFGLVVASIIYVGKQIHKWNLNLVLVLLIGALIAYKITTLQSLDTSITSSFLFFSGMLAICAMILPGISGAFILVIIGAYAPVLEAINTRDLKTIGIVGSGAFVGLVLFSKILKWLFDKYNNITLALLIGFMLGSLNKIWPWKHALSYRTNSKGIQVPLHEQSVMPQYFDGDPQLLQAVVLMTFGFILIFYLEHISRNHSSIEAQ